jgi:hypothetical protein
MGDRAAVAAVGVQHAAPVEVDVGDADGVEREAMSA